MESNSKLYLCSCSNTLLDFNYRYQINLPIITNGNLKGHPITKFENYKSFSTSLNMDDKTLIKLIGIKLSCQVGFEDNYAFFKGTYTYAVLINVIQLIINKFVLCKNCDTPEVNMRVKKKQIYHKCSACGSSYYILDNGEKIYQIMLKSLS